MIDGGINFNLHEQVQLIQQLIRNEVIRVKEMNYYFANKQIRFQKDISKYDMRSCGTFLAMIQRNTIASVTFLSANVISRVYLVTFLKYIRQKNLTQKKAPNGRMCTMNVIDTIIQNIV